jgi:MoaA/NifB/PqqE/SkfB family radical SAM enzyme
MSELVWNGILEGIDRLKPEWIIPYMNNEPLLDGAIFSRIDNIRTVHRHSKIEMSTNGMLLSENKAKDMLSRNIDNIIISLFGSDEENNKTIMGQYMSYDCVKNNILRLKNIKDNISSSSKISVVKLLGNPILNNNEVLKDKDMWLGNGINVLEYNFDNRAANVADFRQRDKTLNPNGCDFNRHVERTYIYQNGDVSFCCNDWSKKHIMGNLNQNSLIDILNNKKYNIIRDMINGESATNLDFVCRSCVNCLY